MFVSPVLGTRLVAAAALSRCLLYQYGKRLFSSRREREWDVDDVINHLEKSETKNVVVMAGAGISTASGIPDFRTPGTGIYDNMKKYNLPFPEAIFDIDFFHHDPKPFFVLAKELNTVNRYRPNTTHYFCRLLHDKESGVPAEKVIQAHGTLETATCMGCRRSYNNRDIIDDVMADRIPKCRSDTCEGVIKPDIVFFGEEMPVAFNYHQPRDAMRADLIIAMGSSFQVQPFASLSDMVGEDTPRMLINYEPVSMFVCSDRPRDVLLLGDLVANIRRVVAKLGWENELDTLLNTK